MKIEVGDIVYHPSLETFNIVLMAGRRNIGVVNPLDNTFLKGPIENFEWIGPRFLKVGMKVKLCYSHSKYSEHIGTVVEHCKDGRILVNFIGNEVSYKFGRDFIYEIRVVEVKETIGFETMEKAIRVGESKESGHQLSRFSPEEREAMSFAWSDELRRIRIASDERTALKDKEQVACQGTMPSDLDPPGEF